MIFITVRAKIFLAGFVFFAEFWLAGNSIGIVFRSTRGIEKYLSNGNIFAH